METNIKLFNNDLLFREDGNTIMKPMEELFYNKRIVMFDRPLVCYVYQKNTQFDLASLAT